MTIILGAYVDVTESHEYLTLKFSPQQTSIQDRWRNNGLSADFLADYWATFFPVSDKVWERTHIQVKSAISYIANELLENAMKFHCDDSENSIYITLYLFPDQLVFFMTNYVKHATAAAFQEYIHSLLNSDIAERYLAQLESNAKDITHSTSRMGFLTMMHDYGAKLGWKFETSSEGPEWEIVTTMVLLPISYELIGAPRAH